MDLFQKVSGLFKTVEPTTEEQVQKTRNELFARQQGLMNEMEKLQTRNALLGQQFQTAPEGAPYATQLFMEIKNNDKQIASLQNQRTIVNKSLENLNTVHTNTQLMTDLNASNKTVDKLMKESRKTIGAPPQRVMSSLQNTSEQTQEITNLISEASLGINRTELDTLNTGYVDFFLFDRRYLYFTLTFSKCPSNKMKLLNQVNYF